MLIHKLRSRMLLLSILVLLATLLFTSSALADGWWKTSTSDPQGSLYWQDPLLVGNSGYDSPHGGYTVSSNLCKTCHAVHDAGAESYRLLKDGSTDSTRTQGELDGTSYPPSENGAGNKRTTECMYCHDADSGATLKKPYKLGAITPNLVLGEHTLGATKIPDSTTTLPDRNPVSAGGRGAELDCYQCHSVHGANTVGYDQNNDGILDPVALDGNIYDGADVIESWNNKILRVDPSGDGIALGKDTSTGITAGELAGQPTAVRTGFCGDCHNNNPNWVATTGTVGPNKTSHIQGRGADGLMEVYGNLDVAVAAHTGESQGCRGCHAASDSGNSIEGSSNFPHQSVGWKLMWDTYDDTGSVVKAGDPNRSLPNMDRVCLMCHPVDNEFETGKGYADANTEENLCFRCHSVANPFGIQMDVKGQFTKKTNTPTEIYNHPTQLTPGLHSYDTTETPAQLGSANRHAECLDCHNLDTVVQGQEQALRGIWGISADNGITPGLPTLSIAGAVTSQYELCFKCHSSYTTRSNSNYYTDSAGTPVVQEDKALAFNSNNNAFHPVEGPGRNQSAALNNTLRGGLTSNSVIKCTDCHNSDDTSSTPGPVPASYDPSGPHGSNYAPILRANYRTDLSSLPTSYDNTNFSLCFLCHSETLLLDSSADYTNFSTTIFGFGLNLHRWHLQQIANNWPLGSSNGGQGVCRACHYDIHGNQQSPNTEYRYYQGGTWYSSFTPPGGVKTRLVNFAPSLTTAAYLTKPSWIVWLDNEPSTGRIARDRQCDLVCHGNNGAGSVMNNGYTGTTNSTYHPDDSHDTDSLTF